jgi:type IV pilus assembly protein PilN
MTQINLLPWREDLRKFKNQIFYVIGCAVIVLGILSIKIMGIFLDQYIDTRNENVKYVADQKRDIEKQVKEISSLKTEKQQLSSRIDVIQSLQADRSSIVKLLDNIARAVPEGLYLEELSRKGKQVSLTGVAQSNGNIANFITALHQLSWLSNIKLGVISSYVASGASDAGGGLKFSIELTEGAL